MKKTLIQLTALILLASCADNELCYHEHPHGRTVNVVNHWKPTQTKPGKGMRLNLFPLNNCPNYGIDDLGVDGGTVKLAHNSQYKGLSYDYFDCDGVAFRNETSAQLIEAYTPPLVRATYSRAFPDENTVSEPKSLHMHMIESFSVTRGEDPLTIDFYPEDVVKTYTFEVTRVRGAAYITDTRGALSGISPSYFLTTGALSDQSATVLFSATKDDEGDRITGSFRTFGPINATKTFTIEILYPSSTNGIIQKSWDVTAQVQAGNHIVVDADIDIIPDKTGGGGGFEADVNEWNNITVPIPM